MHTLYRSLRARLGGAGIASPDLEARIILRHVLKISDADLIAGTDRTVSMDESQLIDKVIHRRINREPLSRILGAREFRGLPFRVTPAVLDPRPDTETLVDAVLKRFGDSPPRTILDLGTGSGCILIALLHEWRESGGTGIDLSPEALEIATENAQINGMAQRARFLRDDWGLSLEGESFDLIVSNPPYIPSGDIPNLDPEVKNHDPILSLDGGFDGLDAYRRIITATKKLLNKSGAAFFELGISQSQQVMRLVEEAGLSVDGLYPDLAGIPRVVEISFGDK